MSGGAAFTYDGRGNLQSDSVNTYGYDADNNLIAFNASTNLSSDPMGRLAEVAELAGGVATTASRSFRYAGPSLLAEYGVVAGQDAGTLYNRYVPGPGVDETVVAYTGAGTGGRQWLLADERGSVIAMPDVTGNASNFNSYDEYGVPGGSNTGRFQYTGQIWIREIGMYHYKARDYSPTLGRFLQTDPVGYRDDLELYAYAGDDPIDRQDPLRLAGCSAGMAHDECDAALKAQAAARSEIKNTQAALTRLTNERAAIASGNQKDLSAGAKATAAALQNQFGDSGASTIKSIQSALRGIDNVLADGGDNYQFVHANIGNDLGRAIPIFGRTIEIGDKFIGASTRDQAVTEMHEAAHIAVPAGDFGYEGANRWEPTWLHLHNADDIAIFTYNSGQ